MSAARTSKAAAKYLNCIISDKQTCRLGLDGFLGKDMVLVSSGKVGGLLHIAFSFYRQTVT